MKAGLRQHLPKRISRGDVANSLEALLGFVWLKKLITLDEIVECLKPDAVDPSENWALLAELALAKLDE